MEYHNQRQYLNHRRQHIIIISPCIVLAYFLLLNSIPGLEAFSVPYDSPWQTASWQLVLNIGLEEASQLPDDDAWGQSGARLSFPVALNVESDRISETDTLLGVTCPNRLTVIQPERISYVNELGQQTVPFQSTGGWTFSLGRKKGHASLLRFWLDVGGGENKEVVVARKKDVTLKAKERLYFAAHCWRQSDWEFGQKLLQPYLKAYQEAQERLQDQLSHNDGDRRLDGNDALETLAAYKDMAALTLDRDDKARQLQEVQEKLPPAYSDIVKFGNWPGSTEPMMIHPMEIFVERKGQGFFASESHHLFGSWTAKPMDAFTDEDYDDDEEEETVDADQVELDGELL